jgi:hypothetical protein
MLRARCCPFQKLPAVKTALVIATSQDDRRRGIPKQERRKNMNPSNFLKVPFDSVLKNSESETIARNIMVILSRTGNQWRSLSWEEYKEARVKDGNFTQSERQYFDKVAGFCVAAESAKAFCPSWAE